MQDSNIVSQVVKIENTNRKSATHFALYSGLHLRYLIDLDSGAKRLSENISTYSKKLSLLMQFINIIPFPILNRMKLGYFVKVELNKEVETCRQNAQKKHWNMIVGTYDEKQKIVLQCFNTSENADFIKIGNAATEKEMNAEISFLQQKRVYSTFDIPQLLGSISRADGATFNIQITKEFVGDKVEPILTQEIVEIYKELSKDKKNGLEFSHGDFAPWNLKRNGDKYILFDWEHCGYRMPGFRYRLSISDKMLDLFKVIIPKPDITFILVGDPQTLYERKREISVQEIQAQIERLLKNKDKFNNSVVIDVNKPVEDVVKDVSEYILETCASKVGR